MDVQVFTVPGLEEEMTTFHRHYNLENIVSPPDEKMSNLKPKAERVCRFCGVKNDARKFKNIPHLIPHQLGNKHLVSDFECDDCNTLFGRYENDLAYSLGLIRTFYKTKGKGSVPSFKSPNELIIAKVNKDFYGVESTEIKRKDTSVPDFILNKETGENIITYTKQSYTPINVYKVLLKIALSILPENELSNYKIAFEFLREFKWKNEFDEFAKIYCYQMPPDHRIEKPLAFLFKKRNAADRLPAHSFALYFENLIYTFPVPLYLPDINQNVYDGEEKIIPLCPPILAEKPAGELVYHRRMIDLSSNELLKGEQATFQFSADPSSYSNLTAFDPATGKMSDAELKPEEIVGIHFVPANTEIKLPVVKDEPESLNGERGAIEQ